ncbi:HNH endonuclease [Miltoncostaea oceani]|uniref:HNH endonuclease n=1 Tax=Miltoncostaea oceani TaxID=2843216 RepID=UPI001C3C472C|nr:HNH endonuclease [Miltoncostaea oceani]
MREPAAEFQCPLCHRVFGHRLTRHHLVPRSRDGSETEGVCEDCHRAIHAFFDNRQIEREYSSIESLRADPAFARQLRFIARQPVSVRVKTATRRDKRRRR